mmetsp:Transcript_16486/g.56338  ORF Transcript_16486/g.56338 Transcript_16486/m.56338 type:complete len:434 (-) Transcript_16486:240-1541(-)
MARLPLGFQALGQVAHAAGRVVRIEEEELRGEDDKLQNGLPEKRQVRLPALAEAVAVDVVGRVKGVDDELGREPGEERDAGDAEDAPLVKVLQGALHRLARRGRVVGPRRGQREAELVGVLDGLAAALAEVWHHWVDGVAHKDDAALGPATAELWPAVVEVALLDGRRGRAVEDLRNLAGPTLVQCFNLVDDRIARFHIRRVIVLPGVGGALVARGHGAESVPLHAAVADVALHEIALRAQVDVVAHVIVIRQGEDGLAGEDGVARVGAALAAEAVGGHLAEGALAEHLRAHGGPDAVGADENVGVGRGARGEDDLDAGFVRVVVGHDAVAVLDKVGFDSAALVKQNLLQVGPVDDARVGQVEEVGAGLERKLDEPVRRCGLVPQVSRVDDRRLAEGAVGPQAVLDAAPARARERELVHDPGKEALVDGLERR